jgi:hypothetical protein
VVAEPNWGHPIAAPLALASLVASRADATEINGVSGAVTPVATTTWRQQCQHERPAQCSDVDDGLVDPQGQDHPTGQCGGTGREQDDHGPGQPPEILPEADVAEHCGEAAPEQQRPAHVDSPAAADRRLRNEPVNAQRGDRGQGDRHDEHALEAEPVDEWGHQERLDDSDDRGGGGHDPDRGHRHSRSADLAGERHREEHHGHGCALEQPPQEEDPEVGCDEADHRACACDEYRDEEYPALPEDVGALREQR